MSPNLQYSQTKQFSLTILILLFVGIGIAFSQEDKQIECPYFNVFSTDSNGVSFSLVSTDINATISGVIANVVVEQTYVNTGDSTLDATYVFPMSSNAAIYGMEMILNGRIIKAEIRRRSEAEAIFENADSAGLTATLLEQERPNVFQMSLANINSDDTLKVRMVYTELLIPVKGIYQFVFPSVVGPRYTTNGEPWVYQTMLDSLAVSETDLTINLRINGGMPVHAECMSHNTPFEILGNSAQTQLSTHPGDDFIVNYTFDNHQIETGLLLYESADENFFLAMIQPARSDLPFDNLLREYIFIMDVSGSMQGQPIEISKQLIINLLENLTPDDKFNIIFFAGGSSVLAPNSLPVTQSNITMAIDLIENINAGGGTELLPALQRALDMEGTQGYSRTFAILTDGYVTVEKEAFDLIRQNLDKANFFSFGIGNSVNRFIIDGIAYVGEGEGFVVTSENDPEEVANTFKEYIERPELTNIKVDIEGLEVFDVEPFRIPDVFAERPIIVYGKYHGPAQGHLTLTGDIANGSFTNTFAFADYTDNMDENIALKYLWARKRIKLMSDYGIASNESDTVSIEEEITLLGLKYSLITAFTSFVAVDSNSLSTDGSEDPDDGDGDGTVEVEDLTPQKTDKGYIKIVGVITGSDGVLNIKLENLDPAHTRDLSLRITNLSGVVLTSQQLQNGDEENILSIPLGTIPSGIYYVSLFSKSSLMDTETFVIVY